MDRHGSTGRRMGTGLAALSMLKRFNDLLEFAVTAAIAVAFAGMVATVALQVIARNILKMSMIWTLDVAQLLFAWCIFLGAAVALRQGRQYVLTLLPERFARTNAAIGLFAFAASVVVVWVMIQAGFDMAERAGRRTKPSLGLSEFWFYVAIPLGGIVSASFLLEQASNRLRILRDGQRALAAERRGIPPS